MERAVVSVRHYYGRWEVDALDGVRGTARAVGGRAGRGGSQPGLNTGGCHV